MNGAAGFQAADIEQAIVSAMLQWPASLNQVLAVISEEHFSKGPNRVLFCEIIVLHSQGKPVELILFTQHLRDKGVLEAVGGVFYVTHTWSSVCHSPAAVPYYIDRLLDEYERQKLVQVSKKSIESATAGDEDAVPSAIEAVTEIPVKRREQWTMADAAREKLERLETGKPGADVIPTGIEKLDHKSQLRNGDMPLLLGERKAGKSILALSITVNVARRGIPVLYFSLEDKRPKVFDRLFAGFARIPMEKESVSQMTSQEAESAGSAIARLGALPIDIRDDVFDLGAIMATARTAADKGKAALIVVDHAQLVRVPRAETRVAEVETVSRDLRLIAMELNVPLLLLCQLNKEGGAFWARSLEMDATAAWQIEAAEEKEPNKRFLRIPWQRNGESGISFPVTFLGNIARVENYVEEEML